MIVAAAPGERNDPTSYLYAERHVEEFGEAIRDLGCLGDSLGGFRYEGREYVIYRVR